MGKNDLKRAYRKKFQTKQDASLEVNAVLGNSTGVVRVPGTSNQVWVRIGGSQTAEKAINDIAPMKLGQGVRLIKDFDLWRVKGTITSGAATGDNPTGVDAHGPDHGWMGTDPVLINLRQITALRVQVIQGSMSIKINAGTILIHGIAYAITEATYDLTSYIPATSGMSKILLITISGLGVITFTESAEFAHASLLITSIPTIPLGHYPLGAIRLYYGETEISENKFFTDIYDLRLCVNPLHGEEHESGGVDEISVEGLHGQLADPQAALGGHHTTHENGGTDEISIDGLNGVGADRQDADHLQGYPLLDTAPELGQRIGWNGTAYLPLDNPSGAGHDIADEDETFPARTKLQIIGASIADDAGNDATVVTVTGGAASIPSSLYVLMNASFV